MIAQVFILTRGLHVVVLLMVMEDMAAMKRSQQTGFDVGRLYVWNQVPFMCLLRAFCCVLITAMLRIYVDMRLRC